MKARARPPERVLTAGARAARMLLYLLLLAAAAAALWTAPGLVETGRMEPRSHLLLLAPALLALFVAGFAIYRFSLVRSGRYHAGKAFVQVGFMVLVLALLLPGALGRWRAAGTSRPVDLTRQLASRDPEARAMAAELARYREPPDALRYVRTLVVLLDDPSAEVRRQARASLTSLAGEDAGGPGSDAPQRWRAFWSARGVAFSP
ncbi:MAG TPA: HEAT repeat domain-containing protein [Anaeromyxobacteraceae bacterium]|nr:HEAT repeat domain-containing protein [Anaeromyxobacteraceae bacterium]